MTAKPTFDDYVQSALEEPFVGWDFSYLDGRMVEHQPSWDYLERVEDLAGEVLSMVDMCTGGGEFLAGLKRRPPAVVATESYAPNFNLAKKRLTPFGIEVVRAGYEGDLPLHGRTFDLVINRHGGYAAAEVAQALNPEGRFVTQQVGADNCAGVNRDLGVPRSPDSWSLDVAVGALENSGFEILNAFEEFPKIEFHDIGALVFYLRAIPWQVPGFDVVDFRSELLKIHDAIVGGEPYAVNGHRFFLDARIR